MSAIRPGANIPMKMKPPTPIPPTQATIRHRREGRCPSGNNRNGNASARNAPAPHTQPLTHCAQPRSWIRCRRSRRARPARSTPQSEEQPADRVLSATRRDESTHRREREQEGDRRDRGCCPPGPPSDDGLTTPATVPSTTHRMQSDQTPQRATSSRAAGHATQLGSAMAGFWPVGPLRRKGTTLPAPRTELPLPCGAGTPHEPWWRPGRPPVVSRRTFASTTNGGTRWAPSW